MTSLFKYCEPTLVEHVLKSRTLRFTPPGELNDPFDCLPILAVTDDDLRKFRTEKTIDVGWKRAYDLRQDGRWIEDPADWKKMHEEVEPTEFIRVWRRIFAFPESWAWLHQDIPAQLGLGVLSMCANPLHPLMWSHYAAAHTGFVAEFGELGPKFRDVRYRSDRLVQPFSGSFSEDAFLTKSVVWAYEEESRAFTPTDDANLDRADVDGKPMVRFVFAPTQLLSVTLGYRMKREQAKDVVDLLRSRDLSHVKVFEVQVAAQSYELERIAYVREYPKLERMPGA